MKLINTIFMMSSLMEVSKSKEHIKQQKQLSSMINKSWQSTDTYEIRDDYDIRIDRKNMRHLGHHCWIGLINYCCDKSSCAYCTAQCMTGTDTSGCKETNKDCGVGKFSCTYAL